VNQFWQKAIVLEERCKGPFSPLEPDWKERVRKAAQDRLLPEKFFCA